MFCGLLPLFESVLRGYLEGNEIKTTCLISGNILISRILTHHRVRHFLVRLTVSCMDQRSTELNYLLVILGHDECQELSTSFPDMFGIDQIISCSFLPLCSTQISCFYSCNILPRKDKFRQTEILIWNSKGCSLFFLLNYRPRFKPFVYPQWKQGFLPFISQPVNSTAGAD